MRVTANAPPTPNSRPVMGVRGSAAFNLLPHHKNRRERKKRVQALLRHLCLEKGSFIQDLNTKALSGSGGSMDTVGLAATRSHLATRWPTPAGMAIGVPALAAGSRGCFRGSPGGGRGHGEEWGFVPTIPKGDFWV